MCNEEDRICANCGSIGIEENITIVRGSGWITLILICFYCMPGIIYWIWRYNKKETRCGACKSKLLIFINSPRGKELYKKYHKN